METVLPEKVLDVVLYVLAYLWGMETGKVKGSFGAGYKVLAYLWGMETSHPTKQ